MWNSLEFSKIHNCSFSFRVKWLSGGKKSTEFSNYLMNSAVVEEVVDDLLQVEARLRRNR